MEPKLTIGSLISDAAGRYQAYAAVEYKHSAYTWGRLDEITKRIAKALLSLGVNKGDRIGIWSENRPNALFTMYGAMRIGAVAVLCNAYYNLTEIQNAIDVTRPKLMFMDSGTDKLDYEALLAQVRTEVPTHAVSIREAGKSNFETLENFISRGEAVEDAELDSAAASVSPEDTAAILFTSGTTAKPKAVRLSHGALAKNSLRLARALKVTSSDKYCAVIPMFHCFGLSSVYLGCLHTGACLYMPPTRHSISVIKAIAKNRCTILNAVPTLLLTMARHPAIGSYDISSLRTGIIGGAMYSKEQYIEICSVLDFNLMTSLGQTEACAGITITNYDDPMDVKVNTVGHCLEGLQCIIVDVQTDDILPAGETGEICIKGDTLMQGYCTPEDDAEAFDANGWLHTGDLGFLDESGNIHLAGRKKEIIIRGGENISPVEIEQLLEADSRIAEAKVIGVPDDHFGEEICACVVPRGGMTVSEDDVRAIVREKLAYYKVPKYVLVTQDLPRTASGKVKLSELKSEAIHKLHLNQNN